MRESIGGTMLFWLVLFFMTIFISFLAAVIQYSRVYKIKNQMINYLEQAEGVGTKAEFENTLSNLGYSIRENGYAFCRKNSSFDGGYGGYYKIQLTATFKITSIPIRIYIQGETRLIETGIYRKSDPIFENIQQLDDGSGYACITS